MSVSQRDIRTPGLCVEKTTRLSSSPSPGANSRLASPVRHHCRTRCWIVTRYRSATVTGSHGLPCICKTAAGTAHHGTGRIKKTCRQKVPRHGKVMNLPPREGKDGLKVDRERAGKGREIRLARHCRSVSYCLSDAFRPPVHRRRGHRPGDGSRLCLAGGFQGRQARLRWRLRLRPETAFETRGENSWKPVKSRLRRLCEIFHK